MAPEVMCKQNHGVSVDYYAVGVIAYECMMGRRPYNGKGRREIRDLILARQIKIDYNEIPQGWSTSAVDFINGLIKRKPAQRLGANGPSEIKLHPWFRDFDWDALESYKMDSPFKPPTDDENFDKKNSESEWKDINEESLQHCIELL